MKNNNIKTTYLKSGKRGASLQVFQTWIENQA